MKTVIDSLTSASAQTAASAATDDVKRAAYKKGLKDGVWLYAWSRDGVQYVGTWGKTLKTALEEIERDF